MEKSVSKKEKNKMEEVKKDEKEVDLMDEMNESFSSLLTIISSLKIQMTGLQNKIKSVENSEIPVLGVYPIRLSTRISASNR